MAATDGSLVVADAGPLIHLYELTALDVLSDYATVFVPNAVWLEVHTIARKLCNRQPLNWFVCSLLRLRPELAPWPLFILCTMANAKPLLRA
ncbi:MAG: hypothetical protein WC216_04395 [Gallionella sp.]|jgi:hypothetical protein